MTGFGIFGVLSGILQLSVPSYSLRLVRRFGTQRVGWFITASFVCLALLHLLRPFPGMTLVPQGVMDLIYAIAALFLVIGLGHVETLCSQRQQSTAAEERLRSKWEAETKERTAELEAANERLIREIARREQCENALRESEAQYRILFAENPQPMWIFDLRTLRMLAVNEATLRQYGYEEQQFMSLQARDLASPATVAGFLQDAAKPCSAAEFRGVWEHIRRDRTPIFVETTAIDLRYAGFPARLMVANDITARRYREQERCDADRRQFAGRLAGGVAHHFNNILSIINGHAIILQETSTDATAAGHLEHISGAINRATTLSRQLLMVSGEHSIKPESLALNGEIQNMDGTFRRVVGDKATIEYSLDSSLPPVFADVRVIEHVLLNLVLNARDAIATSGTITIATAKMRVQDVPPEASGQAKAGNYVCIAVRDNGCGMSAETQERVFEPFFTTRDVRKGAGLGLASAYGAIREHSGWIEFTSTEGEGSEFRVLLPCATTWQKEAPAEVAAPAVPRESVLLIEPDDRVRSVARFILNRNGYRVIEAESADTALALWAGQGSQISLLITETRLPETVSGLELAAQLCEKKPALKVVFTSAEEAVSQGAGMLSKPYTPDKLIGAVQGALAKK
jgi:PAS domain S-box-containing protein